MLGNTALESDKVPGLQFEMDFLDGPCWPFGQLHGSCKWLHSNSHVQCFAVFHPTLFLKREEQHKKKMFDACG